MYLTVTKHLQLEGMEGLIDQFHSIVKDFRLKRHDLLAYHNNKFDRDYVEFNVKISDLECSLQARYCTLAVACYMIEVLYLTTLKKRSNCSSNVLLLDL